MRMHWEFNLVNKRETAMDEILLYCCLGLPLLSALFCAIKWRSQNIKIGFWTGSLCCGLSFLCSIGLFLSPSSGQKVIVLGEWIKIGEFSSSFSFLLDPLSVLMSVVVMTVAFFVHVFSGYYMAEDVRPAKYFSYLALFVFSMLVLVLSENLLLMFLGWELVGLCSYLLIGFWFRDTSKALAGMKAFLVNRVGDIGFLLGMVCLFSELNSLNFTILEKEFLSMESRDMLNSLELKLAAVFLLLGAIGKSAQLPLYFWLPSAMAGPTPISALMHAATMVTAGVYLVLRMNFMYINFPDILSIMAWIGAGTALFAGMVACVQNDIKKVLAYSTVSQLGYMVLSCGLGAFNTAFFHLLTHASFKALLFLCAGSVIHSLKGEQLIYRMGGLRKELPWTWITFLIGYLALMGIPPLSGFFSKDEILWKAFISGEYILFGAALGVAGLTAFYMTRLYILVFHGAPSSMEQKESLHEGDGATFKLPLFCLAFLALALGLSGIPHALGQILPGHPPHLLETYFGNFFWNKKLEEGSLIMELMIMFGSLCLVLAVMVLTSRFYLNQRNRGAALFYNRSEKIQVVEKGFGLEHFLGKQFPMEVLKASQDIYRSIETALIQGFIKLLQNMLVKLKEVFLDLQSLRIQSYMLFMFLGLVVFIFAMQIT